MVGWQEKSIKELADIISGGTPRTTVSEYWDGDIIWVTPTDITRQKSKYLSTSERKITKLGLDQSGAVLLPRGTILLCSRATIGELAIAAQHTATNQGFKNLVCFADTDNEFLYYAIQPLKPKMIERAHGSTFLEISKTALGDIEIQTPPLLEQRAIAATLSNTDEYITSLEKLIAKKRAIKQGAMQELLTGKRRLPGFSGEWVEKRIDDFGVFKSGNGFPLVYQGEHTGYPFYKVSDFSNGGNERIMSKANHYITPQVATILNCNIMPQGAIVFAKIGAAVFLERKRMVAAECCIDNNMMVFIVDKRVGHTSYFCYMMQTIKFGDFVTTTALPSLSAKSIGGINKKFPTTMDEQNAIAAVLSDMDAEIDALTAKLNKAQYIKQGMMSELLTGRIRLV